MLTAVTFELFRFRFHFRAAGKLLFPPFQSGNTVRGAFGTILRKAVCTPSCLDATLCEIRATCPYARVFEPKAAYKAGPSGLVNLPRPFVFRAAHLDGMVLQPGDCFHFDLHSFDVMEPSIEHFARAFSELAREGLGPGRGRANLFAVDQLDLEGAVLARVFSGQQFSAPELAPPSSVDLSETGCSVRRLCIRFVTPTELKEGGQQVERPEFRILFGRVRDRISTLRMLYGPGPLAIDFRAIGERARAVDIAQCNLMKAQAERLSTRTGQRHSIGGFVGKVEYEGNLGEFLPYLHAAKWTGVGRQTVWGKGALEVIES
jgi:hypothetical protein